MLADTSAWACASRRGSPIRRRFNAAIEEDQVRWCLPVRHELLVSARDREEMGKIEVTLASLREVHLDRSIQAAAVGAMLELAETGPSGSHRFPLADLLIAAAAQSRGIAVLHYDRHFDRLAEAMGLTSLWIASPGSI